MTLIFSNWFLIFWKRNLSKGYTTGQEYLTNYKKYDIRLLGGKNESSLHYYRNYCWHTDLHISKYSLGLDW